MSSENLISKEDLPTLLLPIITILVKKSLTIIYKYLLFLIHLGNRILIFVYKLNSNLEKYKTYIKRNDKRWTRNELLRLHGRIQTVQRTAWLDLWTSEYFKKRWRNDNVESSGDWKRRWTFVPAEFLLFTSETVEPEERVESTSAASTSYETLQLHFLLQKTIHIAITIPFRRQEVSRWLTNEE